MIFHEHDPRIKLGPPESPSTPEYLPVANLEQCQKLVELCHDLGLVPDYDVEANYWVKRLAYEEEKVRATELGLPEPYFQVYERNDDHERLHILDPRRRLRLFHRAQWVNKPDGGINLDNYGLTLDSLRDDERHLLEMNPPKLERKFAISDESTINEIKEEINKQRKIEAYKRQLIEVKDQYLDSSVISRKIIDEFEQVGAHEPVGLLETPIRKDDIVPAIRSITGRVAARLFLESFEAAEHTGNQTQFLWRVDSIQKALGSIIHGYHGNVGALVGVKLPVTPEFIQEYFGEELAHEVVPESVTRLQFDAILKPHTNNPVISRVGTVIYEAVNENGDRRVVTTARKADRMLASLAIQSLINESSGITDIVRSGRFEYLTGHPGLGKRR